MSGILDWLSATNTTTSITTTETTRAALVSGCDAACPSCMGVTIGLSVCVALISAALCGVLIYLKLLRDKVQSLEAIEVGREVRNPLSHLKVPEPKAAELHQMKAQLGSPADQGGPPAGQGGPPAGQGGPPAGQGGPPAAQAELPQYLQFEDSQSSPPIYNNNDIGSNGPLERCRIQLTVNNDTDQARNSEHCHYANLTGNAKLA